MKDKDIIKTIKMIPLKKQKKKSKSYSNYDYKSHYDDGIGTIDGSNIMGFGF